MFKVKHSLTTGFSFGLTSGIITTLGLMVGLHSGTHSRSVVLGGIWIIAIADAFSDALGIHISEESEGKHSDREIWESTFFTFLTKFFFALTFVVPVLIFELSTAMVVSVMYGLFLLTSFSYFLARNEKRSNPWQVAMEHLVIASLVVFITHYVGDLIRSLFGA
ncbi:MAG: hypothetical protein NT030_07295 [Candidatus Saganbacteria bacterium]|nr:hypothetical protein [Candidatus Saganbacteria bacterium]